MNTVIDFAPFRAVNNKLAFHLALILGTMVVTGLIIAFIARLLFFWVPKRSRRELVRIVGSLGVIVGLWMGITWFGL
ncbi:hypothetical protein JZ785_10125 [Alicyclobacillus curvatus]|nr:hypothetical protein JZ785_10125 [Alicyclobacillus curvatus]